MKHGTFWNSLSYPGPAERHLLCAPVGSYRTVGGRPWAEAFKPSRAIYQIMRKRDDIFDYL